jgi:hypothetical protein
MSFDSCTVWLATFDRPTDAADSRAKLQIADPPSGAIRETMSKRPKLHLLLEGKGRPEGRRFALRDSPGPCP